jgi:hypothetical protein
MTVQEHSLTKRHDVMLRLDKASNSAVEKRLTRTNVKTKFEVIDNTDVSFYLPQQIQIWNRTLPQPQGAVFLWLVAYIPVLS